MRGERAFEIASLENQRRTHEVVVPLNDGNSMTVKLTLMPNAYFYQSELAFVRMYQQWLLPLVDMKIRVVSPETLRRADDTVRVEKKHFSPYKFQALMLFPAWSNIVKKFAAIQSTIDLARVACALERYRLAHGDYPDTLDTLMPQFIAQVPHDIIGGQPLHYRREANGQFVLYSVGWNETDDGGKVTFTKGTTPRVDMLKGDWVWQYPKNN
jgi:hypothetical protein